MTLAVTSLFAPAGPGGRRRAVSSRRIDLLAITVFAVFGSLVPFNYTPIGFGEAVERFPALRFTEYAASARPSETRGSRCARPTLRRNLLESCTAI